jgi:hypothetical protein
VIAKIGRGSNLFGALAYNQLKVDNENGEILLMNKQIKLHPCIILDMIQNTKREICGPKSIGLGDGPTRKDVSHLVSLSIHPQYRHMIFLIKNPKAEPNYLTPSILRENSLLHNGDR